ncbi:MAG TPA: Rieske (2Fe-2S) protein [Sporichthyaceae bacterium]|jgi:nitrite reductase/ring-hydroxylating ferredoxin subunit
MPEHDDDLTLPGQPPRRTVLRGALALGAAGVLAGCGGSSSDSNAAAQTPADAGAAAPESTPSPTAAAKKKAKAKAKSTPKATASAEAKPKATTAAAVKPKGTELGPTSDIPVNGGKIFDDQKIVVTQPKKGEFLAFSAVCTHQECVLADCDGGTINCGCHNSSFSITDGHPLGGPATVALPKKKVQVAGGKVYEV